MRVKCNCLVSENSWKMVRGRPAQRKTKRAPFWVFPRKRMAREVSRRTFQVVGLSGGTLTVWIACAWGCTHLYACVYTTVYTMRCGARRKSEGGAWVTLTLKIMVMKTLGSTRVISLSSLNGADTLRRLIGMKKKHMISRQHLWDGHCYSLPDAWAWLLRHQALLSGGTTANLRPVGDCNLQLESLV